MLNRYARAFFTKVMTPLARALLRAGVSPDVVTLIGTLGVCVGALAFYPRGEFVLGTLVVTAFVFSDLVDGTMARLSARTSRWGAFLDSTLDRVADAVLFGALVLWYAGDGADLLLAGVALWCLVSGSVTSYAKARAEGLGHDRERRHRRAGRTARRAPGVHRAVRVVRGPVAAGRRALGAGRGGQRDGPAADARGAPAGPRGRAGAVRGRAVYCAYAAGWALVRRLPERAAYALFGLLAELAWRRRGAAVARLEANLARVVGPGADGRALRALSRAGMRSYLRYWCEAFRLPDWDRARTVDSVVTHGEQHLRDPLAAGQGVIAPLPHMGNWDHAGAWAAATGIQVVTVAERLRPEQLFQRFLAYRRAIGMEVLPLTGADVDVPRVLAERLRSGALVPLLADRDLTRGGIEVSLFGEPTRFPAGPAVLALRTGAPVVPVTLHAEGTTLHLRFHPPLQPPAAGTTRERVSALTQQVADVFEQAIRERPQDWHMLARLWLADLAPAHQDALA